MARTEKGSRVKGLPPRIQLQIQDAATGSYPTIVRCSSDNRTGTRKISFNDLYTPVFSYRNNILYPSGMPSGSLYVTNEEYVTSLSGSGSLRKGIGDQFYVGHTDIVSGAFAPQELKPFKDNDLFEVDGKSKNTSTSYAFYATGSLIDDVGEGFTSPLWSKQKIEIPINVKEESGIALYAQQGGGFGNDLNSNVMCYFNKDLGVWQGLWGQDVFGFPKSISEYVNNYRIPISPCSFISASGTGSFLSLASAGNIISSFGFPFDSRYHATSSQLLDVSQYIDKPFIIEKIILTISATYDQGGGANLFLETNLISASINTVFLLNQRKNINFSCSIRVPDENVGNTGATLSSRMPSGSVATVRDIISFHRILSCASGAFTMTVSNTPFSFPMSLNTAKVHDTLISSSTNSTYAGVSWDKKLSLEMLPRSPAQQANYYGACRLSPGYRDPVTSFPFGGRNGLGTILTSGRSLLSEYVGNKQIETLSLNTSDGYVQVSAPGAAHKTNPYILLPTDKLILAWAQPIPQVITYQPGLGGTVVISQTRFPVGNFKLVLYGSYLREGKEFNDTLNQTLGSNTLHEVIEG